MLWYIRSVRSAAVMQSITEIRYGGVLKDSREACSRVSSLLDAHLTALGRPGKMTNQNDFRFKWGARKCQIRNMGCSPCVPVWFLCSLSIRLCYPPVLCVPCRIPGFWPLWFMVGFHFDFFIFFVLCFPLSCSVFWLFGFCGLLSFWVIGFVLIKACFLLFESVSACLSPLPPLHLAPPPWTLETWHRLQLRKPYKNNSLKTPFCDGLFSLSSAFHHWSFV